MRTITPRRERQAVGAALREAHNGAESSDNDLAYRGNSTGVVCTGGVLAGSLAPSLRGTCVVRLPVADPSRAPFYDSRIVPAFSLTLPHCIVPPF